MVAGIMNEGTEKLEGLEWWLAQDELRSYKTDVLDRLDRLPAAFKVGIYGTIDYDEFRYPLASVTLGDLYNGKPNIFISGGVHGYEQGGVLGALEFLEKHAQKYAEHYNFVVVPCVSPAAYERDRRLTGNKANPNRKFIDGSGVPESELVMKLVRDLDVRFQLAIDLHETTWTDPVILMQEGATDINLDDILPYAYLIAMSEGGVVNAQDKAIGVAMMLAAEKAGYPIFKGEELFGCATTEGVITDLEIVNPKAKGLSCQFMTAANDERYAPALRAYTSEPFVTEELFNDPDGLRQRTEAQVVQICAALDAALTLPAPQPARMKHRIGR